MMNNYPEIFCLALSDFSRGEVSCSQIVEVLDIWIVQYFLHYSSKQRNWRGQSFTTSVVSQYHEIAPQHKRLSHSNFKLGAKIELVKISSPTEKQVTIFEKLPKMSHFKFSCQFLPSFWIFEFFLIFEFSRQ